jgi:hypothetical protein
MTASLGIPAPLPAQLAAHKDRRTKQRFAIKEGLRYRKLNGLLVCGSGIGKTINISSSGVRFTCDTALVEGDSVEVSLNWPVLLTESCPMQLMIQGTVIRSGNAEVVVSIHRYDFRTRGMHGIRQFAREAEPWEAV